MKHTDGNKCKTALALPAPVNDFTGSKIVKMKVPPAKKTWRGRNRRPKPKKPVSDEMFLNRIRDDVYRKLKAGEIELTLADGFKAIDLKNKIASPSDDSRITELLEELRRELMK
ncbi:MAG: hypothetical protein GF307_12575 [candidate division Zixibacteria bacterium]|nr:hypothetical protein [candidate division Zixibacteria bacterium]